MRRYEKGESSKKTNPTTSDENERPLKKAKYVWQLKGKYHLKDKYSSQNEISTSKSNENVNKINQSPVKPVLTEKSDDKCTKCINSLIAHSNNFLRDDSSDHEDIPITMVRPRRENHDDFLQKWQARQVAKSFIDNTINTILEQWKLAPTEANDFVENNCDSGQVEDEGIMMAIQSHGLQSNNSRHNTRNYFDSCENISDYQQESTENYQNKQFEGVDELNGVSNTVETDQVEFLSTAVTMAIQNKGLSSYSYG
ncbi:uncharacterized protein [Onthophagus taurus]|uniref:uncharacterized protein n=1 Tax=Onthophagus taurus TaxID=166361 RepID=UPI000C2083D3|nr:uncharacterized protein LOC111429056 [Onthophagus taurus]